MLGCRANDCFLINSCGGGSRAHHEPYLSKGLKRKYKKKDWLSSRSSDLSRFHFPINGTDIAAVPEKEFHFFFSCYWFIPPIMMKRGGCWEIIEEGWGGSNGFLGEKEDAFHTWKHRAALSLLFDYIAPVLKKTANNRTFYWEIWRWQKRETRPIIMGRHYFIIDAVHTRSIALTFIFFLSSFFASFHSHFHAWLHQKDIPPRLFLF